MPDSVKADADRDAFLRRFAVGLGFAEPDVGGAEWEQAEVFREDAKRELIVTLMGGTKIGHSRWDVPPIEAQTLAEEFLNLFGDDARFFCSGIPVGKAQILAPSSRPDFYDYIFDGGCIAVDPQFAAIFWMLDSD